MDPCKPRGRRPVAERSLKRHGPADPSFLSGSVDAGEPKPRRQACAWAGDQEFLQETPSFTAQAPRRWGACPRRPAVQGCQGALAAYRRKAASRSGKRPRQRTVTMRLPGSSWAPPQGGRPWESTLRGRGRGRKLIERQLAAIAGLVHAGPRKVGLKSDVWSCHGLRACVLKKYKTAVGYSAFVVNLHEMGIVLRAPCPECP